MLYRKSVELNPNQADLSVSKRRNPGQDNPNLTRRKKKKTATRRTQSNNSEAKQSIDIAENESDRGATDITEQALSSKQSFSVRLPSIATLFQSVVSISHIFISMIVDIH